MVMMPASIEEEDENRKGVYEGYDMGGQYE
jgi:hypothetical protein